MNHISNRIGSTSRAIADFLRVAAIGAAFFVGVFCGAPTSHGAATTRPFSNPDRIHYDNQCMTIDGKDMVIFSGSFHYFRCPKELWADRFAKIKAAGFNTVETYIAWNLTEPTMPAGLDDFSKVNTQDVDDWLNQAEKNGLYVIVRPGPYICAEFERGGLPGWLETKVPENPTRSTWVRSDDPDFVAWSKHWYRAIDPVLVKHLVTHKKPGEPGIILYQIENEYDYTNYPDAEKAAYVKDLTDQAQADGIDVPKISCWTRLVRGNQDPVLRDIFDSCNFYVGWNVNGTLRDINLLKRAQTDAPLMTTELQGGWFSGTNNVPELRPDSYNWRQDLVPAQINNLTLYMWQNGETITNYYMLFGGTNLGDEAARGIATSYDYSAPIRENGGIDDKYLRVMALGQMLREHGPALARSTGVDAQSTTDQTNVTAVERRAADGSRFIFVRTDQHAQKRSGTVDLKETGDNAAEIKVAFDLEPFGSKVLYLPAGVTDPAKGEWLPKEMPAIARPLDLPASVKITESRTMADPGPAAEDWKHASELASLAHLGIYDSQYVYYNFDDVQVVPDTIAHPDAWQFKAFHDGGDRVVALVNGKRVNFAGEPVVASLPAAATALHADGNQLTFLYENAGYPNSGEDMLRYAGISNLQLLPVGQGIIKDWKMQLITAPRQGSPAEVAADFDDSIWPATAVDKVEADQLKANQSAVFRTAIDITQTDLDEGKTSLNFSRFDDKGTVFVNGKTLGQGDNWARSYQFDAGKLLHVGKNVIAVLIVNVSGQGGLGTVELINSSTHYGGGRFAYSDSPAGVKGKWWAADLDDSQWKSQMLPESPSDATALLSWHRLSFSLPASKPDQWVPWLVRLNATGNGMLYLNGHAIGRYWEKGAQRDFYLPECWLNFDGSSKNVLTLSLCPLEDGTAVTSAEVMPYTAYAEKR